jgi:hypothetical protein
MALRDQLEGKTADERAEIKAQWFAALPTRTFTRGDYSVRLSNFAKNSKTFSVFVIVEKNGVEILRDTFRFVNPPILVPDGTFHTETIVATDMTLKHIRVPNLKEDLTESLKQMLIESVRLQLT